MQPKERIAASRIAKLLSVLQVILPIIAFLAAFLLAIQFAHQFRVLIFFVLIFFALWMIFHPIEKTKHKYLSKAGYGIKALEDMGAEVVLRPDRTSTAVLTCKGREVITSISIKREHEEGWSDRFIEALIPQLLTHYRTTIRVEHRGEIPCVMRGFALGEKYFYDTDAYLKWTRAYGLDRKIPKEAKVSRELVHKASEWVKPILDEREVAAIGGIIIIEPGNISWWRSGGWLQPRLLEKAVNKLVSVAEKIESHEYKYQSSEAGV